jgi:hypothetical protein
VAVQYLFHAANAVREQRGLPALIWSGALADAAERHAQTMAEHQQISHQFAGEPEITARARQSGAHFSVVAENVAEAPTAVAVQSAWMNSPEHRANLLDPRVNSIGIAVVSRGGELFAVDDFDRSVLPSTRTQEEGMVAQILKQDAPTITILPATEDARKTCSMQTGYAGKREPWFVMRYTADDLQRLPSVLQAKLATGKYHEAQVGACTAQDTRNYSAYSIAVMLYP